MVLVCVSRLLCLEPFSVKQKKIVLLFIVVGVGTLGVIETDGEIILSQNAMLCFLPIKKSYLF